MAKTALLDHLKIPKADLIGYSMGGGVAMQCAIRHPEKVRKVVSISAVFRHDGLVKEALDAFAQLTAETFKGSPIESQYRKLSPTPNDFPKFVKRVIAMILKPDDFGADKLKATKAPMFFHPRRWRRRTARAHLGNVPPQGGRDSRRPAAALRIEVGHIAQYNTHHADGARARYRPDGERLS
jgi:pimeloyl-ACP methyl ester carboxylesterase